MQIQKPIHFGQANERDTAIASRNLFCSASSPCNDLTSKAIEDESHTVSHEALISFSLSNDGSKLQLLSIIISIGSSSDKENVLNMRLQLFSYPSVKSCVLGAQKNGLNETVLLSTHNICFG